MIETLAMEHGQSKRLIETTYTIADYYELLITSSLNAPPKNNDNDN